MAKKRSVPDNTREQLSSGFLAHQFQPGANWWGNALGRPKGSRNKLQVQARTREVQGSLDYQTAIRRRGGRIRGRRRRYDGTQDRRC